MNERNVGAELIRLWSASWWRLMIALFYDVSHKLEGLSRNIRDGDYGDDVDAVIALRYRGQNGKHHVAALHYGKSDASTAVALLEKVKIRILGFCE